MITGFFRDLDLWLCYKQDSDKDHDSYLLDQD